MIAVGWGLLVIGFSFFVAGLFRRWGDNGMRDWDRSSLTSAQVRAAMRAVYNGEMPTDELLHPAVRDLAASVLHNYPIVVRSLRLGLPGMLIAALGVGILSPEAGTPMLGVLLILTPLQLIRAIRQRSGAERILTGR